MTNRRGKCVNSDRYPLLSLQNHCRWWLQPWNQKTIALWQESDDRPRQCVEKQKCDSADKGPHGQGHGVPSGHIMVVRAGLQRRGRMSKNWCFQTVVLEETPESPLESKEIKPVNLKGDQPWIFTARTDAGAEAPVFWSSDADRWLTGKVPDAGKDWGQRRRGHQRMRWLDSITNAMNVNLGKLWGMVGDRDSWHAAV